MRLIARFRLSLSFSRGVFMTCESNTRTKYTYVYTRDQPKILIVNVKSHRKFKVIYVYEEKRRKREKKNIEYSSYIVFYCDYLVSLTHIMYVSDTERISYSRHGHENNMEDGRFW